MIIKISCFDRCESDKKSVAAIDSFNENFYDYINRAAVGENPYDVVIDKKWAKFIYNSSKMTFVKVFAILIAIAPSFSKFFSVFTTPMIIKGCYLDKDPNATLPLDQCIEYNQNSPFFKYVWTPESLSYAMAYTISFLAPHVYFIILVWGRFTINRYTLWISSARIQLSTMQKRMLTCGYYYFTLSMVIMIYFTLKQMAKANAELGEDAYQIPYSPTKKLFYTFEKNDSGSIMGLLSSGLIYSCLFIVSIAQIRQPMSFFVGFREYTKEASRVFSYNVATVKYRIERDPILWKFIDRYYQECLRYDPRIVLIAMVTHFIDLEILEAEEGSEIKRPSVSVKVKK